MRIIFFGTSNVALPILEMLHQHHDIAAVVTQPDAPVGRKKEMTESPVSVLANEMELKIFKPTTVKANNELLEDLTKLAADIFIVVSYGKILPAEIINLPPLKTLNVHFSLLPKYRGASPIQFALLNGDKETGTTIMLMDSELDHGQILAQEKHTIDPDDNYISLSQNLAHVSAELLKKTLPEYALGKINPLEQDHTVATLTKIISKQDGRVDWSKSADQIYHQFIAYYPWPGIWTTWNGKNLKITDCLDLVDKSNGPELPGAVLNGGKVVCSNNSIIQINRLQLEGKIETDIQSFLNGYKNFAGSKLE